MTGLEIVVGGQLLTTIAPGWGEITVTDRWGNAGGGCWEMSWTVPVRRLRRHQAFTVGAPVAAYVGPWPRWSGSLSDPDWDTGQMVAVGRVRAAEGAVSLDASGLITTVADVAVDQAVARGAVSWTRRASISATPLLASDAASQLTYLDRLLDATTQAAGTDWGVNAAGEVYVTPPATAPTMLVAPDSGVLGTSDTVLARRIIGRYQPAGGGALANTTVGSGSPEVGVSLLSYGSITPARAQEILNGILTRIQPRAAWTNGITLTAPQVTNPGGCRTSLALIRADGFQTARLQGVRDIRGLDAGTNFVVGESVWDVADQTVQINPVGMVAHDLGSIIEDAGGVLLS